MGLNERLRSRAADASAETGSVSGPGSDSQHFHDLKVELHRQLIDQLNLKSLEKLDPVALRGELRPTLVEMVSAADLPLNRFERERMVEELLDELTGLGPLEPILKDPTVSDILVNGYGTVYVERRGKLELTGVRFRDNGHLGQIIHRIVSRVGRRIDETAPMVDARLKDGSRVNAIIPPLSLKGPCITIRKFKREKLRIQDLIKYKTLTPQMAEFLEMCVKARRNIVISGGTGSGKTTTLNIVSNFIPEDERIVTVEDAAELQLSQDHWVQLESRPANLEGKGQITIRDLVKNCLRMRPDRIVVGECRSGETLDMLQAMNTGHDGSLTTLHANNPRDAIARMETMVLMSGMELPFKAIREQIASAVNLLVQQTRFSDGSRKITYISEVTGMEVDVVTMQEIFQFKQEGFDDNNKVRGRFVASGFVPRFYDELQRRGIPVNMNIFREE